MTFILVGTKSDKVFENGLFDEPDDDLEMPLSSRRGGVKTFLDAHLLDD